MSRRVSRPEKSPDKLQEIKKVTDETLDMSVSVYLNKDKHRIINKVSRNNELWFQAGGGIVARSDRMAELQEVNNKLAALRRAIDMAEKI